MEVVPTAEPAVAQQPATEATPTAVVEVVPSQSIADAERDGVAGVLAALTFDQRIEVRGEATVGDQRWVISSIPSVTLAEFGYEYFVDAGFDPGGGELLLLDGRRGSVPVKERSTPGWGCLF